jgi:hypothetical protein
MKWNGMMPPLSVCITPCVVVERWRERKREGTGVESSRVAFAHTHKIEHPAPTHTHTQNRTPRPDTHTHTHTRARTSPTNQFNHHHHHPKKPQPLTLPEYRKLDLAKLPLEEQRRYWKLLNRQARISVFCLVPLVLVGCWSGWCVNRHARVFAFAFVFGSVLVVPVVGVILSGGLLACLFQRGLRIDLGKTRVAIHTYTHKQTWGILPTYTHIQ